jgi:hypothetical protein
MPRALFADGPDTSVPVWAVVLLLVVGLLVLRWLYCIGFFGKAFRALAMSIAMLVGGSVALYAGAAVTDQTLALEGLITRHADALLAGVGFALLVGTVIHYPRSSPATTGTASPAVVPSTPGVATPAGPASCPTCRGTGQTDQDCLSCSGTGERRCDYQLRAKRWWGEEYVREWCDAGELKTQYSTEGRCRVCCGRGFVKCSTCRFRGTYRTTCERCKGRGTA